MFYNFFFFILVLNKVVRLPKMFKDCQKWLTNCDFDAGDVVFDATWGLDDDDHHTILEFCVSHVSEKGECL